MNHRFNTLSVALSVGLAMTQPLQAATVYLQISPELQREIGDNSPSWSMLHEETGQEYNPGFLFMPYSDQILFAVPAGVISVEGRLEDGRTLGGMIEVEDLDNDELQCFTISEDDYDNYDETDFYPSTADCYPETIDNAEQFFTALEADFDEKQSLRDEIESEQVLNWCESDYCAVKFKGESYYYPYDWAIYTGPETLTTYESDATFLAIRQSDSTTAGVNLVHRMENNCTNYFYEVCIFSASYDPVTEEEREILGGLIR